MRPEHPHGIDSIIPGDHSGIYVILVIDFDVVESVCAGCWNVPPQDTFRLEASLEDVDAALSPDVDVVVGIDGEVLRCILMREVPGCDRP